MEVASFSFVLNPNPVLGLDPGPSVTLRICKAEGKKHGTRTQWGRPEPFPPVQGRVGRVETLPRTNDLHYSAMCEYSHLAEQG